jgi:hypothetical protein
MTHWVVTLEEDPATGELILPLPDEALAMQGWHVGDVLTWTVDTESGAITLTKKSS